MYKINLQPLFTKFLVIAFIPPSVLAASPAILSDDIYRKPVKDKYNLRMMSEAFATDNYDSGDQKNEYITSFGRLRTDFGLKLYGGLDLNTTFKLEDVQNSNLNVIPNKPIAYGRNSTFENEGLFVDRLTLDYNYQNLSLFAGKYTVNFGQAWDLQNGIWNFDMARSSYRQNEKMGAGAFISAGNNRASGRYVFGVSTFYNDRKILDNSLFSSRDNYSKSDARPGDSRSLFSSYAASVDIDFDFGDHETAAKREEKLSYHFSYINLAVDDRQSSLPSAHIADQSGFAANINYRYQFNPDLIADAFIEYVSFDNVDGDVNKHNRYTTSNISFNLYRNWMLTLDRNRQIEEDVNTNGVDTTNNEISFGYKFGNESPLNNLQIMVGYKYSLIDYKTSSVGTDSLGAMVRYIYNF